MQHKVDKRTSKVEIVKIDDHSVGQRIDNFLRRVLKGVPTTRLYRSLRKGEVRVNGCRTKPDYRLALGDAVRIPPLRRAEREGTRPTLPEVLRQQLQSPLYEDGELLVLDKPSGLAVHGGTGLAYGLIEGLRAMRPETPFLELVHRLDRETSGCLLVAKSRRALLGMHDQLRRHTAGTGGAIHKRYLALVLGIWAGGRREIMQPLRQIRGEDGRRLAVVDPAGEHASSIFAPLQRFESTTLMRVELLTGRMHQVRAHAADAGSPIAGDAKYGDWKFNRALRKKGLRRLFLHAESLAFRHPVSGEQVEIEAPLPAELAAVLERL